MKNVPFLILSVLLFTSNYMLSQTVVLINGVPTQVRLEGTEIVEVKGEVKNYLSGFDSSTVSGGFKYAELRPYQQTAAVAVAPVTQKSSATSAAETKAVTDLRPTVSVSSPFISGNYFKFDNTSATLSEVSLRDIKVYSEKIKSGKASSIILESFFLNGDEKSSMLITNRLDACKKYFEVNGVPSNVIVTNMYPNDKESNKVSITLR